MLTPIQLEQLASAATLLRGHLEAAIVEPPATPAGWLAFARLTEGERATQRDLTAASAHLASANALLRKAADREQPVIEALVI